MDIQPEIISFVIFAGAFGFLIMIAVAATIKKNQAVNEKNKLEKIIADSKNDKNQKLINQIPIPVWSRDNNNKIQWVNDAFANAVGAESVSEVIKKNIEILDGQQIEEIKKNKDKKVHKRTAATINGDRKIIDVYEVRQNNGTIGVAIDVDEVEQTKNKLKKTIQSHAQTINSLATAVAMFDENKKLTFYNQAFLSLWEIDEAILETQPDNATLLDMLGENKKIAEVPNWTKWRNGQLNVYAGDETIEDRWHLPNGKILHVIASPQTQGGVTWIFEDITQQLKMESRYIAVTRVQGETLDHLNEAIAVFEPNGKLKLSNQAFQKLWKIQNQFINANPSVNEIARHCKEYVTEKNEWDKIVAGITGMFDERKNITGKIRLRSDQNLDYALIPLPDAQNMITFVDVTASVKVKNALVEKNQALETAQKLKDKFIENMNVEFRRPLTNITGFAQMLQQKIYGELNQKQTEYVKHVVDSAKILQEMIENMLNLATIDAGIVSLNMEEVNITKIIEEVAEDVRGQTQGTGVKIRVEAAEQIICVADKSKIKQAMYNLIQNAAKFSPKNTAVDLKCQKQDGYVVISVRDRGPGIPNTKHSTIFERFEVAGQNQKDPGHNDAGHNGVGHNGVGLGLAVTKSMLELHGGTINIDPDVEQGTKFVCKIPTQQEKIAAA